MGKKKRNPVLESVPVQDFEPDLRVADVGTIVEREGDNPNFMEPSQYAMLVEGIRRWGVIQALTVRLGLHPLSVNGPEVSYEIVDGHHRFRAAKEAGLTRIPVLIVKSDESDSAAQVLALGRIKGEIDLGKAGAMLRELADAGFDDLTLTGFSGGDIQELLKSAEKASDALDDLGANAGGDGEEIEGDTNVGTTKYTLRLSFDRSEDRDQLKAWALAHGPTIEAGILNILNQEAK